jgi:hypothetical protein
MGPAIEWLYGTCGVSATHEPRFEDAADLPVLSEVLGQPRAVAALAFGASIASQGFNLFALGQPGSGKTSLVREYLEHARRPSLCLPTSAGVYNFGHPRRSRCRCYCRQAAAFN